MSLAWRKPFPRTTTWKVSGHTTHRQFCIKTGHPILQKASIWAQTSSKGGRFSDPNVKKHKNSNILNILNPEWQNHKIILEKPKTEQAIGSFWVPPWVSFICGEKHLSGHSDWRSDQWWWTFWNILQTAHRISGLWISTTVITLLIMCLIKKLQVQLKSPEY